MRFPLWRFVPKRVLIFLSPNIFVKSVDSFYYRIVRKIFSYHFKNVDSAEKKELIDLLWKSGGARRYFLSREVIDKYEAAKLIKIMEEHSNYPVCEIGTGNGSLLNFLAEHFSGRDFIGIDLNKKQIDINKRKYKKTSINFICADAMDYIRDGSDRETFFITRVTLTTLTPDIVKSFFALIKEKKPGSVVAVLEPTSLEILNSEVSEIRGGLAYAHNYVTMVKRAGLEILDTHFDARNNLVYLFLR